VSDLPRYPQRLTTLGEEQRREAVTQVVRARGGIRAGARGQVTSIDERRLIVTLDGSGRQMRLAGE
jgi:hypothetical protein